MSGERKKYIKGEFHEFLYGTMSVSVTWDEYFHSI